MGGGGGVHVGGNVGGFRAPAFSQPHLSAHPGISAQQGIRSGNIGIQNPAVRGGIQAPALQNRLGTSVQSNIQARNLAATQANVSSRAYVGNGLAFGNRTVNFANNAYRPAYVAHPGIYHGYWNGNRFGLGYGGLGYGGLGYGGFGYGGYGPYGGYYGRYGYLPFGWGLAGWGLGSMLYNSGYLNYYNPYYSGVGGYGGYNYSQPIPVAYNDDSTVSVASDSGSSAEQVLTTAVAAFKQNDYDTALKIVNTGISQYPSDAVLHEFRALVLFAKGDYAQAAATIHSVLAVGPGWDWTTLSGLYSDVAVYTAQLRSLEAAVKEHPDDGAMRFLLAYHYMSDGYPDSAAKQLQQVTRQVPNDRVAADLLKMISAQQPNNNAQTSSAIADPAPQPPANQTVSNASSPAPSQSGPAIDPAALAGSWKAKRDDGSEFELTIRNDSTFTWSFSNPQQKQPSRFEGKYSIQGNVLSLERNGGGGMLAEIVLRDGRFNFKPVGAPPEDPGLDFAH